MANIFNKVRVPYLDQLRGVAVLSVVVQHYHSDWLPGGGIGVGIFFGLSGFLISLILLGESAQTWRNTVRFILRRFFRIYPLYLTAILFCGYCIWSTKPQVFYIYKAALPGLLTLTSMTSTWMGYSLAVIWTLQVEFLFYVLTPILCLFFGARKGIILSVLTSVVLWLMAESGVIETGHYVWLLALAPGAVLALVYKAGNCRRIPHGTMIGIGIILMLWFFPPTARAWFWQVFCASFAACLIISNYLSSADKGSFPTNRYLVFIGKISYSIYLVHGIFIDYFMTRLGIRLNTFLYFTFVLFASMITYFLIERYGMMIGGFMTNKIVGERQKPIALNG